MTGDHLSPKTIDFVVPLRHLSPNHQLRMPSSGDANRSSVAGHSRIQDRNPSFSLPQSILQEPITMSSNSPSLGEDDLESTYRAEDIEDPLNSFNDFLDDLEEEVNMPPKVGVGKGKELRFCDKIIQERDAKMARGEVDEEDEDKEFLGSDEEDESTDDAEGSNHMDEEMLQGEVDNDEAELFPSYDKITLLLQIALILKALILMR